jgi:hypothetical protein
METAIILSFILGVLSGAFAVILLNKQKVENEKAVSVIVVGLWLTMHTIVFFKGGELSRLFDIAGFGATGHVIGLDIGLLISKWKKK